jgi:hypothetical protein
MEFFRFCPGCGRRFHIKLESKTLVHLERQERQRQLGRTGGPVGSRGGYVYVHEGVPVVVDVEEFQYNYKCEHCGHEWSDKHVEEHKEG